MSRAIRTPYFTIASKVPTHLARWASLANEYRGTSWASSTTERGWIHMEKTIYGLNHRVPVDSASQFKG